MDQRRPIDVGILGATGMVGQQFIRLLPPIRGFGLSWLAASERSEGRVYSEVSAWRFGDSMPSGIGNTRLEACTPGRGPRLVFSALDAAAADTLEPAFAAAGHIVVSNARSLRMAEDVPLLIPEVNAEHLALIDIQRRERGWQGAIVTNPNCAVVVLAMALAPLRQFGIRSVLTTTLQAVSGAGYPGVPPSTSSVTSSRGSVVEKRTRSSRSQTRSSALWPAIGSCRIPLWSARIRHVCPSSTVTP